jgi:hypothetical protein
MNEETLLEQMTRVRPEVLDENALKLFNKIMEVIDERDDLQNRIDKAIEYIKDTFDYREEENIFYNAGDGYEEDLAIILDILGGKE